MKKKIRLNNCWNNRKEIIRRCKANGACAYEFRKLVRATTPEGFKRVLLHNFQWVVTNKIIDHDLSWASHFFSFRYYKYKKATVYLKNYDAVWINANGEIIE